MPTRMPRTPSWVTDADQAAQLLRQQARCRHPQPCPLCTITLARAQIHASMATAAATAALLATMRTAK
jgi:hypothetical protein